MLSKEYKQKALHNLKHMSDNDMIKTLISIGSEYQPNNATIINKDKNIEQIKMISSLEFDWNGYGSPPVPESVINLSIDIINTLDIQPEIFPTARKSIQFEYHKKDKSYLEFEIYESKITILIVEKRDYDKSVNLTIEPKDYFKLNGLVNNFFAK